MSFEHRNIYGLNRSILGSVNSSNLLNPQVISTVIFSCWFCRFHLWPFSCLIHAQGFLKVLCSLLLFTTLFLKMSLG